MERFMKDVRKVVLKVGTTTLTNDQGVPQPERFKSLAKEVAYLYSKKIDVVVVSSGAIATGVRSLGLKLRPKTIEALQACASIGQPHLMLNYEKAFKPYGFKVAQVLLARDDLEDRRRFLNAKHAINELLSYGAIPIINENDTVVIDEIKVGDNDNLAAMVTNVFDADLLWILTDLPGLFTADPRKFKNARHIPVVENIDKTTFDIAGGSGSWGGVGGMKTKIEAARTAAMYGIPTVISDGREKNMAEKLLGGGLKSTIFLPSKEELGAKKHWIAFTLKPAGKIFVDDGAKKALIEGKKSLLPMGIAKVELRFEIGDPVDIVGSDGIPFARGLANYSSYELNRIKGKKSSEIEGVLGYKYADEAIHRDDMVLIIDHGPLTIDH